MDDGNAQRSISNTDRIEKTQARKSKKNAPFASLEDLKSGIKWWRTRSTLPSTFMALNASYRGSGLILRTSVLNDYLPTFRAPILTLAGLLVRPDPAVILLWKTDSSTNLRYTTCESKDLFRRFNKIVGECCSLSGYSVYCQKSSAAFHSHKVFKVEEQGGQGCPRRTY